MTDKSYSTASRSQSTPENARTRSRASLRVPLVAAHLRPGHLGRRQQSPGKRLDFDKELRDGATGNIDAATKVGQLVATRAKAVGVSQVAFDRSGFKYHGRVKALADAAREAGLEF